MKKLSGGCTLDCFDCCKFNVYVEDEKVVKIEGDKNHPYTKGFICKKGMAHLQRHNHPNRQYKPLLKVNGQWKEILFNEALEIYKGYIQQEKNPNYTYRLMGLNYIKFAKEQPNVFKMLFIPINQLFSLYPWSKLIITIPFAYIYRLFYLLVNKNKELKKAIKYKKDENYYLLKSLNLNTIDNNNK